MATSEATARKGGPERAGALHLGPVILFDLGPVDLGPTDVLHLDPVVLLDPRPPRTAMASAAGGAYADATMADAYDALAARLSDRYAREVSWLRNGQLFVGIAGGARSGKSALSAAVADRINGPVDLRRRRLCRRFLGHTRGRTRQPAGVQPDEERPGPRQGLGGQVVCGRRGRGLRPRGEQTRRRSRAMERFGEAGRAGRCAAAPPTRLGGVLVLHADMSH